MSKDKLIKRLSWYYPTERFNALLFAGVIIFVLIKFPPIDTIFLLYGLFIMTFILLQGQHYWKLKLYRLTDRQFEKDKNLEFFVRSKEMNKALLSLSPVVAISQLYIFNWTMKPNSLFEWAILANLFALLEYINYYHRQLMIDNWNDIQYLLRYKRLKIASLAKYLNENEI